MPQVNSFSEADVECESNFRRFGNSEHEQILDSDFYGNRPLLEMLFFANLDLRLFGELLLLFFRANTNNTIVSEAPS